MTYSNFPVYIGGANYILRSPLDNYMQERMIFAESVNVNYNTKSRENRRLGESIDQGNQFVFDGDVESILSFGFYLYPNLPQDSVYSFLVDDNEQGDLIGNNSGRNYFPIKVGNNIYNRCYLSNYAIEVSAFEPVKCSAEFISYERPESFAVSEDVRVPYSFYRDIISGQKVIYGNNCLLSGLYDDVVNGDEVPRVRYQKNYNPYPSYVLGQPRPKVMFSDGIDVDMSIDAIGLSKLYDYKGHTITGDIGIRIQNFDNERILPDYYDGFDFVVHSGALVRSESYRINGGDSISTTANIKEVVL